MQLNFVIEYQPTFFSKTAQFHISGNSKKKCIYNYLDVLNLECSDQLIMITNDITSNFVRFGCDFGRITGV
jgi:hypothetical protein